MKETKHLTTFSAIDDEGQEYTIHVFQDFIISRTNLGVSQSPGFKSMRTDDGEAVNFIEAGKYEVLTVFGRVIVTSDDPNAPQA